MRQGCELPGQDCSEWFKRQDGIALFAPGYFGCAPSARQIVAGGEGAAGAPNNEHLDLGVLLDLRQRLAELGDQRRGHRVELFGTVQGERPDQIRLFEFDVVNSIKSP